MKPIHVLAASIVSTLIITGCASTPDPAEICTAEWIEPRADRALTRIEKRVDTSLKAIRSASESWIEGDSPGPIQMYRLSRSFKALETELTTGPGIRDLRQIANTCDDPEFVRNQVEALFKRSGLSDMAFGIIERLGWIDRMLRDADIQTEMITHGLTPSVDGFTGPA